MTYLLKFSILAQMKTCPVIRFLGTFCLGIRFFGEIFPGLGFELVAHPYRGGGGGGGGDFNISLLHEISSLDKLLLIKI